MPTHKDITALRKAGRLDEAFKLATGLLAAQPNDIWTKRAMGWVRYERLKPLAKLPDYEPFIGEWAALSQLVSAAPEEEAMITEQLGWQAASRLFAAPPGNKTHPLLNTIFASLRQWTWEKPSEVYSRLLKAFLKAGKEWPGMGAFVAWWDLANLAGKDYLPEALPDGKKPMALAEQAYIARAKALLQRPEPEAVAGLVLQLERLAQTHPEYQYPAYYQAKLLAGSGSRSEALASLLPFARRKQQEIWLWDLMADIFEGDTEKTLACLCRAVTCPGHEKFKVNVRMRLARLFGQQGETRAAHAEMHEAIETRKAEGWKVDAGHSLGLATLEGNGGSMPDRMPLYQKYLPLADDLLYADIPEQIGVVTHLNTEKKVAHFIVSRDVSAHFKYGKKMPRVRPGDFVAVRLEKRTGKEGDFWVPVSAKPTGQPPLKEVYKSFEGMLKRVAGKGFGFADDVFLPPEILRNLPAEMSGNVRGSAYLSFDKTKKTHKWKAVTVDRT